MQVKSLGYQTDLIFTAFDGEIIDRGHYLVVRTPSNPAFYWGNYLLFDRPPREGDFQAWQSLFAKHIGSPPQFSHKAFVWDSINNDQGVIEPFLDSGYQVEQSVVLVAQRLKPPTGEVRGLSVRPLQVEDEWQKCLENQVACREPQFAESGYRLFLQRQMERYQAMTRAGLGAWFGAFYGSQLIADLGIFKNKQLGRYQSVQTHPDYRKQGIARRLVYEAGNYALSQFGLERLVLVAEAGSSAERLYKASGFEAVELKFGIIKMPE